ncbi:hypothetical protein [Paenibacillus tepidiphilus]
MGQIEYRFWLQCGQLVEHLQRVCHGSDADSASVRGTAA